MKNKTKEELTEITQRLESVEEHIKLYKRDLEKVLESLEFDLEFLSDTRGSVILLLENINED